MLRALLAKDFYLLMLVLGALDSHISGPRSGILLALEERNDMFLLQISVDRSIYLAV